MSTVTPRLVRSAVALIAGALLLAGCASSPSAPAPTSTDGGAEATSQPSGDGNDVEVAWLDEGRSFAVVTHGSSTCVPQAEEATASMQSVSVTLVDVGETACTKDLVPRATFVGMPEGVDVTKDVDVQVSYGDLNDDADLDGLTAAPSGSSAQEPSAGWFDDDGIVLLTWGSSSCPPKVADVKTTDAGADVTFEEITGVCTMDLAPRVTVITLPQEPADDDAPFTLTLSGGNLSGEVEVLR